MKTKTTLILSLFPLLLPLVATAQSDVVTLQKKRSDETLITGFKTGSKVVTVSAAGTLVFESGFTLTGASYFRAAAGLVIGTNVQAYDADLTTYAGITPSANVQSLLGAANYGAMRTQLGLVIGTDVQAYNANLTTYAGITPAADVQSLMGAANYAAMRTQLGLVIGTNVQGYDGDLTAWAGLTPSSNVQTFINAATFSNMRSALGVAIGTNVQAYDANTTILGSSIDLSSEVNGTLALASLAQGSASSGQALAWNGSAWAPATISSGITIGTTTISGASANDILTSDGTNVQKLTPGTGVSTALGNAVNGSGGLLTYGIIGTSGATVPLLNAANTFSATQTTQTLAPSADDTYNLGSVSPSNKRYRDAQFSNQVNCAYIRLGPNGSYIYPISYGGVQSFRFLASNDSSAPSIILGLTTSSYVALKPNGAGLLIRNGDDSAMGTLGTGALTVGSGGTPATKIKSGVATLTAGTVTVSDTDVLETGTAATSSRIFVTRMTDGGTIGDSFTITRVNATSFTITSKTASITASADTSVVSYLILNP